MFSQVRHYQMKTCYDTVKKSHFQKMTAGQNLENQQGKARERISQVHGFCINRS